MKKLIIILLFLTTTQVFAKEKTIKFHPPETEAERALDRILNCNNVSRFNTMITENFKKDNKHQKEKKFLFQYIWFGWDVDIEKMNRNERLFYYYTHKQDENKVYVSLEPHLGKPSEYNKPEIIENYFTYNDKQSINHHRRNFLVMQYNKKEKIWQLYSICFSSILEINCTNPNHSTLDFDK